MSLRPLSALSAKECDVVTALLQPDPVLSFYWDTAIEDLAREIDNRLIGLCSGGEGVIIGAAFGDLTVFSPSGRIADADISLCVTWPGAVEIHAPRDEVERYRRLAAARLLRAREMLVMGRVTANFPDRALNCRVLGPDDAERVAAFYGAHYPETVFASYMLDMVFVGAFAGEALVACAGTIAESARLRVVLIGHFATAPAARNEGLATSLGKVLLGELRRRGFETAYLATTTDNPAAIRVYRRLGFEIVDRREQLDLIP